MNLQTVDLAIIRVRHLAPKILGTVVSVSRYVLPKCQNKEALVEHQQPSEGRARWGHPTCLEDLSALFVSYLHKEIESTPFSPSVLSAESQLIMSELEQLVRKGWWTVGSQPAVDGAPSEDETVGWGPAGGYVYQKAFVEFFAKREVVYWMRDRANSRGVGYICFYAANSTVNKFMGGAPVLIYQVGRLFQ